MALWSWLGLGGVPEGEPGGLDRIELTLKTLGPRARYAACYAYILTRAARADHEVTDDEIAHMAAVLSERAGVPAAQASEIIHAAREAARQSGGTEDYLVTREFAGIASREEKLELLDALFSIGASDKTILTVEDNEIRRVASELKLEHADYIDVRRKHLEHLKSRKGL